MAPAPQLAVHIHQPRCCLRGCRPRVTRTPNRVQSAAQSNTTRVRSILCGRPRSRAVPASIACGSRGRTISDDDKRWDDRTDWFEVRKGDTAVRSVWTNSVRNAFLKQAGWAKLQKVGATALRHIGWHACGIAITIAGCRRRRKERKRQGAGVSKMKGNGSRNALRI